MDSFTIKVIGAIAKILIAVSVSLIVIVIGILVMKDVSSSETRNRRCPRCGRRSLRKRDPEDKRKLSDSDWICSRCGNDSDEFSN